MGKIIFLWSIIELFSKVYSQPGNKWFFYFIDPLLPELIYHHIKKVCVFFFILTNAKLSVDCKFKLSPFNCHK